MNIANLTLDNNIFLAPMAGISDLPYRLMMKEFGAALVFTEMVSANGLIRSGARTCELLDTTAAEQPLAVQLFGDDPAVLAAAAQQLDESVALLDINMGCPVPKVVRSGAGSALLRDPERVSRIIAAVRRIWRRPLTIKIRSGWEQRSVNFHDIARRAVAEGVDAITLHPRTRAQGFSGQANWEELGELVELVPVPVIGSGDLFTADDVERMLALTGCAAVMIGRGGYGNPWLFAEILTRRAGRQWCAPTPGERHAVAHRHLHLAIDLRGERRALAEMRKHLCWYARGLSGAAHFRSVVNTATSRHDVEAAMADFFFAERDAPMALA